MFEAEVMMEKVMRFVTTNIKRGYLEAAIMTSGDKDAEDTRLLNTPAAHRRNTHKI